MERNFIGGSDIAAVMGMSRWKTPLQLWAEKTGRLPAPDLSDNEAVEWGKRLEEVVAKKFAEKNGVKVLNTNKRYIHPEFDYMTGEIDRLIVGTDEILECKTSDKSQISKWEEDIPVEYILQVMWYMGLSERKKAHIAVLVGGNRYMERTVVFDSAMFDNMVNQAKHFWEECVKKELPPASMAADNSVMVDLYPYEDEEIIEANEKINDAIALLQEVKMHIDEMKKEKDGLEAKIKQVIGGKAGLKTNKYQVTWKEQRIAPKILTDLMKEDGIYGKYTEERGTRVMRVKLLKEER